MPKRSLDTFHQRSKTPMERLEEKTEMIPFTDCHIFTGYCDKDGYGRFWLEKQIQAHRASALLHKIPNPENKDCVCHSCDNPPCVNPKHLFWGSNLENTQDRDKKGRGKFPGNTAKGERHGNTKLSEKDILKIREMKNNGIHYSIIMKKYKIKSKGNIYDIFNRKSWSHI